MFSTQDLAQFAALGIGVHTIEEQLSHFRQGFPYMQLVRPATVDDGILRLSEDEVTHYSGLYQSRLSALEVVKFVPASGAASRMFKSLFALRDSWTGDEAQKQKVVADNGLHGLGTFFARLKDFAFYEALAGAIAAKGQDLKTLLEAQEYGPILSALLDEDGLGYGSLPKGLLLFHQYVHTLRTPVEEHLVEGGQYAAASGRVRIHFTVSPEHRAGFEALIHELIPRYQKETGYQYEVSFSEQKSSTDTVAVNLDNTPFRASDGSILFRPAGHGALLENLNDLTADVVFIKNIDNVVPDHLKSPTIRYKQALGGVLLYYQEKIFGYLRRLEGVDVADQALLDELKALYRGPLCTELPAGWEGQDAAAQTAWFRQRLHRPIKVCGMVKNEGEPGGGPFWCVNRDGTTSLQIVESAQIDSRDDAQKAIAQAATHFNPVDLVCAVKDDQGQKFDLLPFRDPQTGFISQKSQSGRDLKALELPGLWNGAMSDWNTIFVEVPISTFNPVKVVNDLLRPEHQ